jgi:hypothetical protein
MHTSELAAYNTGTSGSKWPPNGKMSSAIQAKQHLAAAPPRRRRDGFF